VNTTDNSGLGQTVLVGANGHTLYEFEKDESDESYCNGDCTKAWPPLTTSGAPKASGQVDQSKLGTIKRDDGTMQVTYAGHPLYYYAEDDKSGDAKGNEADEFGAEWYALQPSGDNAESGGSGGGGSS
jgi:predicted lipoprotein with Yx(FWY)xxD motif